MKKRKLFLLILAIFCLFNNFIFSKEALATGSTMSAVFPSNNFLAGAQFQAKLVLNTGGQNIVAINAIANYDSSAFEVVSIDITGSPFQYEVKKSFDSLSGKIYISASHPTPGTNSNSVQFAIVNLRALKSFTGAPFTLKFDSVGAVNDCAAILDDGKGTNVLSGVSSEFSSIIDTSSLTRSSGFPTGTLASGATQTTLSLTTNKSATCKYSTNPGTNYSSMTNTFSSTNSTNHSTIITGLINGKSYSYHVRCQDNSGNSNTDDYTISFSVAAPDELFSSVVLTASPDSGLMPLTVSLIATVSGTATGNLNYTFYCDRNDMDTNITPNYQAKYDNQTETAKTASNICSYTTPGTHTAKVIVERNYIRAAETRVNIIVTSPAEDPALPVSIELWKGSDSSVWVVQNNLKSLIRSINVFSESGYKWEDIKNVSDDSLNAIPVADLIKTADNPDVYRLEKNFKRKLASIEIFNSYNLDWNKISIVSQPMMDSFSYAPIYQHNSDMFWRDANNILHRFPTMSIFTLKGYDIRDLIIANDMEYGSFAIGEDVR